MERAEEAGVLRIGELSRRVGVSDHVLRAWEARYGLFHPIRSAGGFRLYSPVDERRVRRMQFHLARGLSAAEAAHAAIGETLSSSPSDGPQRAGRAAGFTELAAALRDSLDALDEPTAQATLDRLMSDLTLETVLRDVLLPYLYELGERWRRDEITIAQEHFASNVIRGRLGGLARGWGTGHGPRVVIACPPGELHDLPLMMFGIVLNRRGWRVDFLGANTPVEELVRVAKQVDPYLVVVAAVTPDRFAEVAPELSGLAEMAPLALAGVGATRQMADELGARLLTDDPVTAAENEAARR